MLRRVLTSLQRPPWKPLTFSEKDVVLLSNHKNIEEETIPDYLAARYYPTNIGQIIKERYQVVGKLGDRQHVALKLYVRSEALGHELDNELDVYRRVDLAPKRHAGRNAIRSLLDSFVLQGPTGQHRCLVLTPLWDSLLNIRYRNDVRRLPVPVVAFVLKQVFQALQLLHEECHVVHTDIKEANILLSADASVLKNFEAYELQSPSPKKEIDGRSIYLSRPLGTPKDIGVPKLCDFGSAVPLDDDHEHREDIQPDIYRCPEVILDVPWSYSVDIWNVGCVVWNAFQGESLFSGQDTEFKTYRGRAHLAEMIALLGPPPMSLLARARLRSKFFDENGVFSAGISMPPARPLEDRETTLLLANDLEDRARFLRFMRKMLQWEPEKRSSASELINDEWIVKHT